MNDLREQCLGGSQETRDLKVYRQPRVQVNCSRGQVQPGSEGLLHSTGEKQRRCDLSVRTCTVSDSAVSDCDLGECSPQAPLSMGFSGQEYGGGLPFPPPGDPPCPGLNPRLSHRQMDSFPLSHLGDPEDIY